MRGRDLRDAADRCPILLSVFRPTTARNSGLAAVKAMAVGHIDEDAPVLNTIRFRKGTLVASDKFLARYFKYVADFPDAPALSVET